MPAKPTRAADKPEATEQTGRKSYVAPALRVYGDASTLTRAVSNTSKVADGGTMATSKTS